MDIRLTDLTVRGLVEIACVVIMLSGLVGVLMHRFKHRQGLGMRAIQFLSIVFVFPTVILLALENAMDQQAAGTLVAALAGYLFANFGMTESGRKKVETDVEAGRPAEDRSSQD